MIPLRDSIPSRVFPVVNVAIIATCVIVFFMQVGGQVPQDAAFRPAMLTLAGDISLMAAIQALLLSMFMHGGLMHLGGNMLFLWVFGDNIEGRMGHVKYLLFYLICGVIATLAHSLFAMFTGAADIGLVGASGAIAGVLGAYLVLFRHARVRTLVFLVFFVTVIDLPSPVFLIYWLVIQVFSMGAQTGVAYLAHIGGFAAGYLLVRVFADTTPPRPPNQPPQPRVTDLRIEY